VNALANAEVGTYLNEHCVCTFQKVGTFQIVNGQKQGGNVASYFCLGDGSVLHVVAGPVDAATLLREARWVVETRKLAIFESRNDAAAYRAFFRRAHADRLKAEYGVNVATPGSKTTRPGVGSATGVSTWGRSGSNGAGRALDKQGKVHMLLVQNPLPRIDQVYKYVFEQILNEKVSTLPVGKVG
jgi:hypothetical protein